MIYLLKTLIRSSLILGLLFLLFFGYIYFITYVKDYDNTSKQEKDNMTFLHCEISSSINRETGVEDWNNGKFFNRYYGFNIPKERPYEGSSFLYMLYNNGDFHPRRDDGTGSIDFTPTQFQIDKIGLTTKGYHQLCIFRKDLTVVGCMDGRTYYRTLYDDGSEGNGGEGQCYIKSKDFMDKRIKRLKEKHEADLKEKELRKRKELENKTKDNII